MSASSTISNLTQALNCAGKCDCCDKLQNQINDLNQKINGLDNKFLLKNEKPDIIQNSVSKSQELIMPIIGATVASAVLPLGGEIAKAASLAAEGLQIATKAAAGLASLAARLLPIIGAIATILASVGILQTLGGRIDAVEQGLDVLGNDVSRLYGTVGTVKRTAENAQAVANTAIQDVKNLAAVVSGLYTKLSDLIKQEIAILTKQILDAMLRLQGRITNLETQVAQIIYTVTGLASRLFNVENSIGNIDNKVNKLEQRVGTLEQKVGKLEQAAVNLYTLIFDAINDIINAQRDISDLYRLNDVALGAATEAERIANQALSKAKALEGQLSGIRAKIDEIINRVPAIVNNLVPPIVSGLIPGLIPPIVAPLIPSIIRPLIPPIVEPFIDSKLNEKIQPYFDGLRVNINNYINNTINNIMPNVDLSPVLIAIAGTNGKIDTLTGLTRGIKGAVDATRDAVGKVKQTLETVNDKMGKKLPQGLSGWMLRFSFWSVYDRVIALMTLGSTIHNAMQLSSALGETLGSIVNNVVSLFGIKDSEGNGFNLSDFIGSSVSNFVSSIIGAENFTTLKESWAKANRIYQASANVLNSLMNVNSVITNGLEVIGSYTGKIGNALRSWGVVGEKAFAWMNPQPSFDNKWIAKLEQLQNTASTVQMVSQVPIDAVNAVTELTNSTTELTKAIKQDEGTKDGLDVGEAAKVKVEKEAAKAVSKAPIIIESDLEADQ